MPIKVSSAELITKDNVRYIACYYNSCRPKDFEAIEMVEYKNNRSVIGSIEKETFTPSLIENARGNVTLPLESPPEGGDLNRQRCNYGFRIASTETNRSYSNGTHKYMRWQMKNLASMYNYPPFSVEEEVLLFRVIRFVLGKENVFYFRTYDQAIKNSPCFNHVAFSDLFSKSPPQKSFLTNMGIEISKPVVDKNALSLSANSGWKFHRVRI
jgi:hypothetical protein